MRNDPMSAGLGTIVKCLANARGAIGVARDIAVARGANAAIVNSLRFKAIPAASTDDPAWSGSLVDNAIVAAFIESLRHRSWFARLLADGMQIIPRRTRAVLQTGNATGYILDKQGKVIPLSRMQLAYAVLPEVVAAALIVMTEEMADSQTSQAQNWINRQLRSALADVIDTEAINRIIDTTTQVIPCSGADGDSVVADLSDMFSALPAHKDQKLFFLMRPETAKKAMFIVSDFSLGGGELLFPDLGPDGGEIKGVEVIITESIGLGEVILIDASRIAGSFDEIDVIASDETNIEMEDEPVGTGTTGGAGTSSVSMFSTNSVAIKAVTRFGIERLNTDALVVLSDCVWGDLIGNPVES